MRKTPPFDADRSPRPTPPASEPAPPAADVRVEAPVPVDRPGEPSTAPSLVWPPAEDEMNEWEVLHLHSTGHTVIEPMKYTPPAARPDVSDATFVGEAPTFVPPTPTPLPYVPPSPIDDPVGEARLMAPMSSDFDLPETELIEPLHAQSATLPTIPAISGTRPAAVPPATAPAEPDDRTVMIPRAAILKALRPEPVEEPPQNVATRILVGPNFAATVGHAPTVPVSALHRSGVAPRPEPKTAELLRPVDSPSPADPLRPMADTLPAGITREWPSPVSDDTIVHSGGAQADTHPVPSPVTARPTPTAVPPSPFSRVHSRGPQPVASPAPGSGLPPAPPLGLVPPPTPLALPSTPRAASAVPTAGVAVPTRVAPHSPKKQLTWLGAGIAALLVVGLGVYQYLSMRDTSAAALSPATLSVDSAPAGALVSIDGTPRGKTPLRLELTEGSHALDVTHNGVTRRVPLVLVAGTVTAHSFEYAVAPVATAIADSAIDIRSEPQGGRVLVDGIARGTTPIVVTGLTAGKHEVQVSGPFRTQTRTANLAAKQQLLLVITPGRAEAAPPPRPSRASAETGYITVQSPIVLRIVRNGDFVGTSEDTRLSLPAGPQVIGLENESVGFRDVRTVDVAGGKTTNVAVTLPNGAISINARPWAEVFVDGQRIGETPVSQLALPVGIHEIVFRHPDHAERRVSVVVKIGATGRAFTDFTK